MISKNVFPAIDFVKEEFKRGKGSYLITKDNKRVLDLNSGQFCTILGHGNHLLNLDIYRYSRGLINTNTATITNQFLNAVNALGKVLLPMKAEILLMSTGAEAVEAALRYAKNIKNRSGVVSIQNGYHGLSLGAQSVTFEGKYSFPKVDHTFSIDLPNNTNSESESINQLIALLSDKDNSISCVIVEPIIAVGGMVFLSFDFLDKIIEVCRQFDTLVIFDESQTGYGRTGRWFTHHYLKNTPDILIMAKAIGLGFPVSAVAFNSLTIDKSFITVSNYNSHQNDPFSASVILAGIKRIQRDKLLQRVSEVGAYFLLQLEMLVLNTNILSNPRGRGLMIAIDIVCPDNFNSRDFSQLLGEKLLSRGMLVQFTSQGKVMRILPDYYITKRSIRKFINILNDTVKAI